MDALLTSRPLTLKSSNECILRSVQSQLLPWCAHKISAILTSRPLTLKSKASPFSRVCNPLLLLSSCSSSSSSSSSSSRLLVVADTNAKVRMLILMLMLNAQPSEHACDDGKVLCRIRFWTGIWPLPLPTTHPPTPFSRLILSDITTTNCSFSQAVFAIHFACEPRRKEIGIHQAGDGSGTGGLDGMPQDLIPQSRKQKIQNQEHTTKATDGVVSFIHGAAELDGKPHLHMEIGGVRRYLISQSRKQILQNQHQPSRATVGMVRFNQWQWLQPVAVPPVAVSTIWFHLRYPQFHQRGSVSFHRRIQRQCHLAKCCLL